MITEKVAIPDVFKNLSALFKTTDCGVSLMILFSMT